MFSPDFKEFIKLLIEHKVEYLIVGGYAVVAYGHPRYTGDLDIWLKRTPENAALILKALHAFGFSSIGLKEEDFTLNENVIQLGYPPLRIDLLTEIDGVNFTKCYENMKQIKVNNLLVNFISLDDLIKNKMASGRLTDLDDIDHLK